MLAPLDLPSGDEPDPNTLGWHRAQLRSRGAWLPVPDARATRGQVRALGEHDARRLDLGGGSDC
jgi:hypothetical protein